MRLELAQVVASAWPVGVSLAAVVAAQGFYGGRRRRLNEALHELRRPLQALALAPPVGTAKGAALSGSVQMVAAALERLEREINGGRPPSARAPLAVRPLLEGAVRRWRGRAALAGGAIRLHLQAAAAVVEGDDCALAQAIDNLIVNAIEHGGPRILVEAEVRAERLRIAVVDSGRADRPAGRRESPAESFARLLGRSRHGHGLRVVRRTAADHGGGFRLERSARGTEAVLDLPLRAGAG